MHASPYHVYPASNSFYPAQTAFQNPPSGVPSVQSNNSSPQFNLKRQQLVSVSVEDVERDLVTHDYLSFETCRRCHQSFVQLHIRPVAKIVVSLPGKVYKRRRSRINYKKLTRKSSCLRSIRCFQRCQRTTFGCS